MATEYFVTRRGAHWYVDVNRDNHGPYLSRRDAVLDALDAAEAEGRHAVVLVKEPGHDATVLWRHGSKHPRPLDVV
ncbi:MAG TPA: hypothetical protein VEY95_06075 [Azospirillaceae bacterium]|nr:hypothetical protein [Azospirillaceae bacterium]